jgi:O-antigen/teichoic acid export membrane protein
VAEPSTTTGRRNPLPEGTLAVGVGLLLSGVAIYAFLAVASRQLGEVEYAPLLLLWYSVFLVGPGFFLPVEQEVSRALAARRARGEGGGPLVRSAARLTAGIVLVLLLLIGAASPLLLDALFEGQVLLLLGLALGVAGIAVGFVTRGALSAQGRFKAYAVYVGADGIVRLLLGVGVAIVGVTTAGWFGLAIGIAPFFAVALALRGQVGLLEDGPPVERRELSSALAALLTASVLAFTLLNIGPLAINHFADATEKAAASRFGNGVFVARVPLFLFQAVQASLLPRLSALAESGQLAELRAGMKRLLVVTAGLGVVGTVGASSVGPFVVRTVFGPEFDLDNRTLGLLALSSGFYMLATAIGQAVIALSGHRLVAGAWAAGVVAFGIAAGLLADDLFLRVELGLVAGAAVATACMAAALTTRLRAGATFDSAGVIEALHDLPLEP